MRRPSRSLASPSRWLRCSPAVVVVVVLSTCARGVLASSNGCLWKCDVPATGDAAGLCVFTPTTAQEIADCPGATTDLAPISTVYEGDDPPDGCGVGSAALLSVGRCDVRRSGSVTDGTCSPQQLTPSPLPLTNGDCVVTVDTALSGTQLGWATVMVYGLALRNKLMFHPEELQVAAEFDKWTRPLADCAIKVGDVFSSTTEDHQQRQRRRRRRRRLSGGGTANLNTAAVREMVENGVCSTDSCAEDSSTCGGNGPGASNYVLQYLEEGVVDLACLLDPSLSVNEPDRCAAVRSRLQQASAASTTVDMPDCWVAGWEALFGVTAPTALTSTLDAYVPHNESIGEATCEDGDGVADLSAATAPLLPAAASVTLVGALTVAFSGLL